MLYFKEGTNNKNNIKVIVWNRDKYFSNDSGFTSIKYGNTFFKKGLRFLIYLTSKVTLSEHAKSISMHY